MDMPRVTTALPPDEVRKAWKAAQDFEAVTLTEFLKPMFDTVDSASGPFGGREGEQQWKPMLIDAMAKKIAHGAGLGIAAPVFHQMIQIQEARERKP